jgi:hypothetical protein
MQPTPPLRHFGPEKALVVQPVLAQAVGSFAVARLTQALGGRKSWPVRARPK